MRYRLVARLELDGCSQGFGYFGGDIVLNHQDVVEGAVVGFEPDDVAVVGTNQARVDAGFEYVTYSPP